MPALPRPWLAAVTLAVLLPTWRTAGGMREDEFHCEHAVAHLAECCPELPEHAVQCTYSGGCGWAVVVALSISDSQCIQDLDCDAIVAGGICERVLDLGADAGAPDAGGDAGPRVDVCP